jgi:hypothetical protein
LLFLAARSSPPPNRLDDLTMDFVSMPYLHHNPEGIPLTDPEDSTSDHGARLSSYTFSADQLAPGDTLTVRMNWHNGAPLADSRKVTLRLVSPAEHLPDLNSGPLALAEDSVPLAANTLHRLTVPENTPRGLYLVQVRLDETEHGHFYLRPVRVTQGAPVPPDAPVLAFVGPDIQLHGAELAETSSSQLVVQVEWSTTQRLAANYAVSVRLLDPDGITRASRDAQPGYGFAPTSLWRTGVRVGERYNLPLPDDLPPGDGYRLVILFYQHPSLSEVARVGLGPFPLPLESPFVFAPSPRLFELPPLPHALDVDYGDQIRLAGYALGLEAKALDLTLWWVAQDQPRSDYTVFIHLFDPASEAIAAQRDAMPRQGSYPTSGWQAGEVVSDTVQLSLSDLPPGDYRLAVGLYEVATGDRLPVVTSDGTPLPNERLILPDEIKVPGE